METCIICGSKGNNRQTAETKGRDDLITSFGWVLDPSGGYRSLLAHNGCQKREGVHYSQAGY